MDGNVIFDLLSHYGMFAIFLLIMIEYACFPISSEIVLPLSGMVAAQLGHKVTFVILISVIAGILGSSFCYFLGRIGGNAMMECMLCRFPKAARQFQKTCDWQQKYGKLSVMIARVIPIFRTYISFAAGITKQNYLVFVVYSGIGILSWNTILISCGYLLGENFDVLGPYFCAYSKWVLILLAAVITIVIIVKKMRNKKKCSKI